MDFDDQESDDLAVENTPAAMAEEEPNAGELPSSGSGAPKQIRIDLPEPQQVQPTFYWTWRLLADGYSVAHLRQVRNLDDETIFDHAIRAIEANYETKLEWLLEPKKIDMLQTYVAENPSARRSSLLSGLPRKLANYELMFFLKSRQLQSSD